MTQFFMEMNPCACLGPMYGEPYCGCEMASRGLARSPEHAAALVKAEADLKKLFEPGGPFYRKPVVHGDPL